MTRGMAHQPGDTVKVECTTTDGQTTTTAVTITRADRLGCGCQRLACPRPGPAFPGALDVMHVLTGCGIHPTGLLT